MIRFDAKTQIIISDNLLEDVWALLQEERAKEVLLIADRNIMKQQEVTKLSSFLQKKIILRIHDIEAIEPTTDIVNKHAALFNGQEIDLLIGIGGGSTLDLTKALSVMLVNEGKVEDYHGTGRSFTSGIKKILIPTTAGTGSEVTPGAVLLNKTSKFKRAISGKYVAADYAILNASLTLSMPDDVTAYTGMDALAHAIESFTARNSNEITKMYSKQAFSLIYNNLPKVLEDKKNIKLRQKVLLGSCLAGYAICNSNTGACHSLAYSFGIYNNIPHGVAVAYLLPKIVRLNFKKGCYIYADLCEVIENIEKIDNVKEQAEKFVTLLENFKPLHYLKGNLKQYGISENNYEFLAQRGLDLASALNNNPVEFSLEDSKQVIRQLI